MSTYSSKKPDPLQEIFEDLMSRFIINVPESEIATTDRICFQIEQAHWYYEDFYREDPSNVPGQSQQQQQQQPLPGFTLKRFAAEMFQRCPLLTDLVRNPKVEMEEIYKRFVAYKMNIPVCGAIILNEQRDKVLLVRGWTSKASWTFPKGKINQNETEVNCAIREVMEEVGFDISSRILENDYIERVLRGEQRNRLYIITGISEDTEFCPQTRKEIGDIKWHWLKDLPGYKRSDGNVNQANTKYFMVRAFLGELQRWLSRNRKPAKKSGKKGSRESPSIQVGPSTSTSMLATTPDEHHAGILKEMLGISDTSPQTVPQLPAAVSHPSGGTYPPRGMTSLLQSYPSVKASPHSVALLGYHTPGPHYGQQHSFLSTPSSHTSTPPMHGSKELGHKESLLSILKADAPTSSSLPKSMPTQPHLRASASGPAAGNSHHQNSLLSILNPDSSGPISRNRNTTIPSASPRPLLTPQIRRSQSTAISSSSLQAPPHTHQSGTSQRLDLLNILHNRAEPAVPGQHQTTPPRTSRPMHYFSDGSPSDFGMAPVSQQPSSHLLKQMLGLSSKDVAPAPSIDAPTQPLEPATSNPVFDETPFGSAHTDESRMRKGKKAETFGKMPKENTAGPTKGKAGSVISNPTATTRTTKPGKSNKKRAKTQSVEDRQQGIFNMDSEEDVRSPQQLPSPSPNATQSSPTPHRKKPIFSSASRNTSAATTTTSVPKILKREQKKQQKGSLVPLQPAPSDPIEPSTPFSPTSSLTSKISSIQVQDQHPMMLGEERVPPVQTPVSNPTGMTDFQFNVGEILKNLQS